MSIGNHLIMNTITSYLIVLCAQGLRSKKNLRESLPITHARDVAVLIQSTSLPIFDLVPDNELIDIRFLGDIFLLKNSKDILIEEYYGMESETRYSVGQLDSQCRTIVSGDIAEFIKLYPNSQLPVRYEETLKNYNECLNRQIERCDPRDYRSLVRLIRANVSNSNYFDAIEDDCNDPCLIFSTHYGYAPCIHPIRDIHDSISYS